jgi:hypothetical protein
MRKTIKSTILCSVHQIEVICIYYGGAQILCQFESYHVRRAHYIYNYICKVKFSPYLTSWALCREGEWGSGCKDPHFLHLGTCWRWVVNFTPQPLYPGERAPAIHWIGGWLGRPQNRSGRCENSGPHQDSNSDPLVVQPVASLHTDWALSAHINMSVKSVRKEFY